MSNILGGKQGTAYLGTNAHQPPNMVFSDRDPTQYDINYSLGDIWLNETAQTLWVLVSLEGTNTSKGPLATWVHGFGASGVLTITGTAGGPISPDGIGNINLGSTIPGLQINGNPGTNTLSFDSAGGGGLITQFQGDAGAPVAPDASGIIHVESIIPALSFTSVGAPANTINLKFTGTLPGSIMQSLSGTTPTIVYPDPANGNIQIASSIPGFTVVEDPVLHKLTLTYSGALPGAFIWQQVPGASQAMAKNNGYIANNAGMTVCTLPALAAIGDMFAVTGMNNDNGWRVAQNAGQTIYFGEVTTTTGIGGYIQSTKTRDLVFIVCTATNTDFQVTTSIGNINFN